MNIQDIVKITGGRLKGPRRKDPISGISTDSRTIKRNEVFVAIKGSEYSGDNFINEAIRKGAGTIISSSKAAPPLQNISFITVPDTKKALAKIAAGFYKNPSTRIKTVGITGTNGKTTVSYLVESIFNAASKKAGRIGTINYKIEKTIIEPPNTTPSSLILQKLLRKMVDRSLDYAVMEVSSHSLAQHRTDGVKFDFAVFTNITSEHLDYHKNFRNYLDAKKALFRNLGKTSWAILNADDPNFNSVKKAVSAKNIITYGIKNKAHCSARNLRMSIDATRLTLYHKGIAIELDTSLLGRFNVYNILAAASTAIAAGIKPDAIKKGIEGLKMVPGRLEKLDTGRDYSVIIDYAHTDDALKNVLESLRAISKGKIITLFGCGGDRDRLKRPRMGQVASLFSDFCFITSDNPRNEDPARIANEIARGIKKGFRDFEIMLDRKKAIKKALGMARANDIVLIAGKGHETYQVVGNKKIPFSDKETVKEILGCV